VISPDPVAGAVQSTVQVNSDRPIKGTEGACPKYFLPAEVFTEEAAEGLVKLPAFVLVEFKATI
jgi:hypothetical protein